MPDPLHLVRLPVDGRRLAAFARMSLAAVREVDDGYAVHALLAALFDHGAEPLDRVAPKPFSTGDTDRRVFDVLGYSKLSHEELRERAERFADPIAWDVCALPQLASRPMPTDFPSGTRLGFTVRCCPTRRVKQRGPLEQDRAEVDAYLARLWALGPEANVEREPVYREWLAGELGRAGAASIESAVMERFQLGRFLRRSQGEARQSTKAGRPDVTFRGTLVVADPAAFSALLARGVGRHRSFGFGMLLLSPPPSTR